MELLCLNCSLKNTEWNETCDVPSKFRVLFLSMQCFVIAKVVYTKVNEVIDFYYCQNVALGPYSFTDFYEARLLQSKYS